ncbi:MAG: hypothetical protein VKK42_26820 [Lyngbya sp.]|nr:hypothetical protein [Lyngbya sp.]
MKRQRPEQKWTIISTHLILESDRDVDLPNTIISFYTLDGTSQAGNLPETPVKLTVQANPSFHLRIPL